MTKLILVLGGYGNFGKRICQTLAKQSGICLMVAGRNLQKAQELCQKLRDNHSAAELKSIALDISSDDFPQQLKKLQPFLVVHTSGPFQGQGYAVPQACIDSGSHYVDLADDRRFVCDITTLNSQAIANKVSVISGASSVPGLSSTVIDYFRHEFSTIESLDIAIAPGNRAERGEATVKAILSYTGHAIQVFERGRWVEKIGWMSPRKMDFGPVVGKRLLANVDVPDLELFPARYAPVKTVNFQAGLELPLLHWTMVGMAWLAQHGLIKSWAPLVKPIVAASNWLINFGSDNGGMIIKIKGLDSQQKAKEILWRLTAEGGVGPYIPTLSAIILAQQLIEGKPIALGATPCLGLYSLQDFSALAQGWGIYNQTFLNGVEVRGG